MDKKEQLIEMKQADLLALLASDAPAPGGGSAAALCGALGAGLGHMVAALSAGRQDLAQAAPAIEKVAAETEKLQARLAALVDEDTAAFGQVTAVFAMPKGTDEEKAARREAMQAALKACTRTPFDTLGCAVAALRQCDALYKAGFNANTISDLGVAALCLGTAARGAWLNVLTNVGGIKDEAFATQHRDAGAAMVREATALADSLYDSIEKEMGA